MLYWWLNVCGANWCNCHEDGAALCHSLPLPMVAARMAFFPMQPFRITACCRPIPSPCVALFSPRLFPCVDLLAGKLMLQGIFVIIIIIWPGELQLSQGGVEGGVCHHKGKDITFTVKEGNIWCLFPPPSLAESSSARGRERGGSCDAARCFRVCKSRVHPSPFLCCVLSNYLLFIVFFSTWGWGKKKKNQNLKRCYPKIADSSSKAVKTRIHAGIWCRIQLLLALARALAGSSGKVEEVARSCLQQISHILMYVHTCASV